MLLDAKVSVLYVFRRWRFLLSRSLLNTYKTETLASSSIFRCTITQYPEGVADGEGIAFLRWSRWFDHSVIYIDTEWFYKFCGFKKRCIKAGKELGGVRCKFGLLSVAIEQRCCSGTGNSRIVIWAAIYGCREASKRGRMFITGHGTALVS